MLNFEKGKPVEIYFGEISPEEMREYMIEPEDMLTSPCVGGFYQYKLTLTDVDTIRLSDNCGRMVPIGYSDLNHMIQALTELRNRTAVYVNAYNDTREVLGSMKIDC